MSRAEYLERRRINAPGRPEVVAFVSGDTVRDPMWNPARCACQAEAMGGDVERTVGGTVHGTLVCLHYRQERRR